MSATLLCAAIGGALAASCESAPPTLPEDDGWDLTEDSQPIPVFSPASSEDELVCEAWTEQEGWYIAAGVTCYCAAGYTLDYQGEDLCVEQEEGCITGDCEDEPPGDPDDPDDETPSDPGDPDDDDDPPQDTITVSLECDNPVERGSVMTCTLTTDPPDVTLTDITWEAEVQDLVPSPSKTGGMQWSGVGADRDDHQRQLSHR